MTICNRVIQQPSVFNNNYTNNFNYTSYNRQTNVYQTFINNDNANLSINNNITVNNYNQYGQRTGLNAVQPGFNQRIGQFLCGYRQPVQTGCGCRQPITFGKLCYQPIQRFCSSIAGKLRSFMGARFSNV